MKNSKMVIFYIMIIILISISGITYAFIRFTKSQTKQNNFKSLTCLKITLPKEENDINLENEYPISDTEGEGKKPYKFTVKNTCETAIDITVNLENLKIAGLSSEQYLNNNFIKVQIADENNTINSVKLLSDYNDTNSYFDTANSAKELTTYYLAGLDEITFELRMWMDYETTWLDGGNKQYVGKIFVNAAPSNKKEVYYYFKFTNDVQTLTIPQSGTYRLETWGAQGGNANSYPGGYGGYSSGEVYLEKGTILYINVGGAGTEGYTGTTGGYNGGGNAKANRNNTTTLSSRQGSGGGATHIATKNGLLSALSDSLSDVLIASGGGGGADYWPGNAVSAGFQYGTGGGGGGFKGVKGTSSKQHVVGAGGTQTEGGSSGGTSASFGQGGSATVAAGGAGGGGGLYGGGASADNAGAGGGSGYIGNAKLSNKSMYCYNCEANDIEGTKTICNDCFNASPIKNCSKEGDGYARITFLY